MGLRTGTWLAGGIAALVAGVLFVALRPDDADIEPVGDVVETESVPATVALGGRLPKADDAPPPATEAGDPKERPGSVRMRVVRAPDDAPVPGIPVFLRRDVAPRGPFHLLAWTDERGLVVFPEVWPGTGLRLRVQAGAGPRVERDDVVVRAGEATDLGDVRLGPLGLVDALVVDETGKPIEDARVVATLDPATVASLDTDPFPLPPDPPSPVAAGRSDNHGRVRLEGVPPGIVALRATKTPLRGATDRARVPAAGADSAVVTIVLRPGALAGLVVVAADGPVVDLAVRFGEERLDGFLVRGTARTDSTGLATCGGFAGFVRFDTEFDVPGRGTFAVSGLAVGSVDRVTLGDVGRYPVLVVDEAGRAVAGARVGALSTATRARATVAPSRDRSRPSGRPRRAPPVDAVGVTGADGRVMLDTGGPPSGLWALHHDYLAYGDPPALRTGPRDTSPQPSSSTSRIVLLRGVRVAGSVTDPEGRRAPGARVRVVTDRDPDSVSALTDAEGRFSLAPVRPERTRFLTATRASPDIFGWCRLPPGASSQGLDTLHIALAEPSRVRGRVTDARGARVEGARVSIAGREIAAWTDAHGAFVLGPVFAADADGPSSMVVEAVHVGFGVGRLHRAWPRPGHDVDGLELSVGETKDVEGYVHDSDRRAVPFPIVELIDTADADLAVATRILSADQFGTFVFRDVPPGVYQVRARARGLDGLARDPVEVRADGRSYPKIAPVILRPARIVRGAVTLARDGTPLPGVLVVWTSWVPVEDTKKLLPVRERVVSDEDGRFSVATLGSYGMAEARTRDPDDGSREIVDRQRAQPDDVYGVRLELR